jgi:hypothetical protein
VVLRVFGSGYGCFNDVSWSWKVWLACGVANDSLTFSLKGLGLGIDL